MYYGFRYYTPSTGRWLCRDPINESGFHTFNANENKDREFGNLYVMVMNTPLGYVDPLGLSIYSGCKLCKESGSSISAHNWIECDGGFSAGFYPGTNGWGMWGSSGQVESPDHHAKDDKKKCTPIQLGDCCSPSVFQSCVKAKASGPQPIYSIFCYHCQDWAGDTIGECRYKSCGRRFFY